MKDQDEKIKELEDLKTLEFDYEKLAEDNLNEQSKFKSEIEEKFVGEV